MEPTWTPKITLSIGIESHPFDCVYLADFKEQEKCENEKCGFSSPRKDRMKRHRDVCRDTTEIVTKRVCYGLHVEEDKTSIPDDFFTNPKFHFAVFDIETVERPSDQVEV